MNDLLTLTKELRRLSELQSITFSLSEGNGVSKEKLTFSILVHQDNQNDLEENKAEFDFFLKQIFKILTLGETEFSLELDDERKTSIKRKYNGKVNERYYSCDCKMTMKEGNVTYDVTFKLA